MLFQARLPWKIRLKRHTSSYTVQSGDRIISHLRGPDRKSCPPFRRAAASLPTIAQLAIRLRSWLLCGWLLLPFLLSAQPLILHDVTVVDVHQGDLHPRQVVRIDGNRITSIHPVQESVPIDSATMIPASGQFLIPGLWDMHAHAMWPQYFDNFLKLFIANGITGFRDMWGSLPLAETVHRQMAQGQRPTQRMMIAGNLVDGSPPVWQGSVVVTDTLSARIAVDSLAREGAAFIKVYSRLSPAVFLAIARRCRQIGLPFAGHVPARVTAADAARAGQRSMEHLYGVLEGCSSQEAHIIEEKWRTFRDLATGDSSAQSRLYDIYQLMIDTQNADSAAQLFQTFVAQQAWQVPTLITNKGYAYLNDSTFTRDDRMRYVPPMMRAFWDPAANPAVSRYRAADWTQLREMQALRMKRVGDMFAAGVPLLAGSDTPNPYCFPGFGLHDELALLVEAGLSPLAALQTATSNAADFMGMSDSLGHIAPGMLADLVLLEGNPLTDIGNTRRIVAVIANGELIERPAIDSLLLAVARDYGLRPIGGALQPVLAAAGVQAAIGRYRQLKAEDPQAYDFSATALIEYAAALIDEQQQGAAVTILEMAAEEFPDAPGVFAALGNALVAENDLPAALAAYRRALTLQPDRRMRRSLQAAIDRLQHR